MSSLFDPQHPNIPPSEPEAGEPAAPAPANFPAEGEPAAPAENPSPRWNETPAEPFKTSPALPPDLARLLAAQRGEDAAPLPEPPAAGPVYKISAAEPDWSDYTMPPLEDEPPAEDKPSGWQTAWAVIREVGETIILTLIIFFLIQTVIRNFRVVGTSMVDNLHDGQYLIIDKVSYNPLVTDLLKIGGPQRGDVIVFEPPNRPGEDYVKRIIGLPGEQVEIRAGQVYINGIPLAEPFKPNPGSYTMPNPMVVPEGQVFVLGDNRNNSNDSHNWGTLPMENIVGRAWLSYWPPTEWGVIPRDEPTEQATLKYFLSELVPQANAGNE